MIDNPTTMKELLTQLYQGVIIREDSYVRGEDGRDGYYPMSEEDAMIQACGGDVIRGNLLVLFNYWSNDISSMAAHYGVGLERQNADGTQWVDNYADLGKLVLIEIPPAPSPDYYWYEGTWCSPEDLLAGDVEEVDG